MWGERLITAPTGRVVSLQEVKDFLRLDGEEIDSEISRLIAVATERAQVLTRRQFLTATRKVFYECFPETNTIYLPWAPLISVTAVTYSDTAEASQTLSNTLYRVDTDSEPGRIRLNDERDWPSLFPKYGAVQIEYQCGYGSAATSVPESLRHVVLMMVGHFYENRGEITKGATPTIVPCGVQALVDQYVVGDEFYRYGAAAGHDV